MSLDILASRERQVGLLDRYGSLLTERQRRVLDLRLRQDWSLSEIASHQGTSRAAVHDLIRRATAALEEADGRLGLLEEERNRKRALNQVTAELAELKVRLKILEGHLGRV